MICEGKKNNLSNICVGKYIVCKQIPGSRVSLRLMTDKWERQNTDYTHTIYTLSRYLHTLSNFTHISLSSRYRNIHYKYTLDTLWDVHPYCIQIVRIQDWYWIYCFVRIVNILWTQSISCPNYHLDIETSRITETPTLHNCNDEDCISTVYPGPSSRQLRGVHIRNLPRAVIGGGWRHWDCTLCTCPGLSSIL